MLTWAIVTMFLRSMRTAHRLRMPVKMDVGCFLMLSIPADILIIAILAYLLLHIR